MGKEKKKIVSKPNEAKKIVVGLYPDESDKVKSYFNIDEVTSANIRESIGLKRQHRGTLKTDLRNMIRDMTPEEVKEVLNQLGKEK